MKERKGIRLELLFKSHTLKGIQNVYINVIRDNFIVKEFPPEIIIFSQFIKILRDLIIIHIYNFS